MKDEVKRIVPDISFYYDKSLDTGMRLSSLITSTIAHDKALSREFGTEAEENAAEAAENEQNLEEED